MTEPKSRLGAIILCGGKSSRMGTPKHLLPFGDQVILQRVVATVREVTEQIVVVAAKDQELPDLPSCCRIERDAEGFQGPLYGLMVGLKAFADSVDAAYLSGCDVPLLKSNFVQFVLERLDDADAVVVRENGFYHPLAAAYRTSVSDLVATMVKEGERRPRALLEKIRTCDISTEEIRAIDPLLHSLRNMNCPDDYAELLAIAGLCNSMEK